MSYSYIPVQFRQFCFSKILYLINLAFIYILPSFNYIIYAIILCTTSFIYYYIINEAFIK